VSTQLYSVWINLVISPFGIILLEATEKKIFSSLIIREKDKLVIALFFFLPYHQKNLKNYRLIFYLQSSFSSFLFHSETLPRMSRDHYDLNHCYKSCIFEIIKKSITIESKNNQVNMFSIYWQKKLHVYIIYRYLLFFIFIYIKYKNSKPQQKK